MRCRWMEICETEQLVKLLAEEDIGICESDSGNWRITGSYERLMDHESGSGKLLYGFQQEKGGRIVWENNNWNIYDRMTAPSRVKKMKSSSSYDNQFIDHYMFE